VERAKALTNSESVVRDAENAGKNACETGEGLARQPSLLETGKRTEAQVLRNSRAECRTEPPTNVSGNQFEAGVWLPERYTKEILEARRAGDGGTVLILHIVQ
jgi:hypothetical protein